MSAAAEGVAWPTLVWGSTWMNGTKLMKGATQMATTAGPMANMSRKLGSSGSKKAT